MLEWCRRGGSDNAPRTLVDQLQTLVCIVGAYFSFGGPVVMGTVIYVNAASVSVANFDLFLTAARGAMRMHETIVELQHIEKCRW